MTAPVSSEHGGSQPDEARWLWGTIKAERREGLPPGATRVSRKMLLNTVKRPLAIAVSASLVAHLLIAGWLIWSLTRWVQPTDKPRVMTLQFSASAHDDPQKLEADLRSDTLRDTAVAKRASSPVELKPAQ